MLYIGENLKVLRKRADMTQDDVAGVLGVSPQSVSKWERGDTFPDITLLPSLANLFNVSVDSLIGMEKINDDRAVAKAFHDGQRLLRDGDSAGAADAFSQALKVFPNNDGLMLELALVLTIDGGAEKLTKAEFLCERILTGNSSEVISSTARAVLCYVYLKSGDKQKAVNTAQSLPHIVVCRGTVLDEIEAEPSPEHINRLLSLIMRRENPEFDVLVIDFGIDMVPMAQQGALLDKINEVRASAGKDKAGLDRLPPVRVRDNEELAPRQVRVRYYSDFLIDAEFDDYNAAVSEVLDVLRGVVR
ncbi:MAG: helix-turn-helix domain-containing protein [Oscillospiraceae bacterium]|nr:helix-turn-helix domain-containing protein [Oscillospiraceae bacterium]